jgi:hypothetical protein
MGRTPSRKGRAAARRGGRRVGVGGGRATECEWAGVRLRRVAAGESLPVAQSRWPTLRLVRFQGAARTQLAGGDTTHMPMGGCAV